MKWQSNLKAYLDFFLKRKANSNDFISDLKKVLGQSQVRTIFDVGAHEGKFSKIIYDNFRTSKIYAFEPFPDSFKRLSTVLDCNQSIQIFQIALSSTNGNQNLFINEFSETNSLFPSIKLNSFVDKLTSNKDLISVRAVCLDTFCVEHYIESIDILKLDTQGSELNILKGGSKLLQSKKILAIYCEVEFIEIYRNQPLFDEIFKYLKQYNYFLYKFYNFNFLETGQLAWADALFILDEFSQIDKK